MINIVLRNDEEVEAYLYATHLKTLFEGREYCNNKIETARRLEEPDIVEFYDKIYSLYDEEIKKIMKRGEKEYGVY